MVFFFVIFVIIIGQISSSIKCPICSSQYSKLSNFFDELNGRNWTWKDSGRLWSFDADSPSDPCTESWQGISCNYCSLVSQNCSLLSGLNLTSYNLKGQIPSDFFKLFSSMEIFEVPFNSISGMLPLSIGSLTAIKIFDISNNLFDGPIPKAVGNMTSALYFACPNNFLTGPIPMEMARLGKLLVLNMGNNSLTGPSPMAMMNWKGIDMISMDFSNNQLTGNMMMHMPNMSSMLMRNNHLTGTLPAMMGMNRGLTSIQFDFNHFSGTFPATFGSLQSIVLFTFAQNILSGPLDHVFNPSVQRNLATVDISSNGFSGSGNESESDGACRVTYLFSFVVNIWCKSDAANVFACAP